MGITGCCNKSEYENFSSPRVFSSYRFFARVLRDQGGRVGPSVPPVGHPKPHAGPPPWCRLLRAPNARDIGAICCGETPKPRMPRGEVPIKHGSSDGGLATAPAREISLLAGSPGQRGPF